MQSSPRELAIEDPTYLQKLSRLADPELEYLLFDWEYWARPAQLLPPGNWAVWLILAGRGFGKTRVGAETVRVWYRQGFDRINFLAATADDLRDTMVEGESGILAVCPKDERPVYRVSKRRLEWPNGAISLLFTAEEPERLRGKQGEKLWGDELASWRYDRDAWDMAMFGLRLGRNPQAVVTTTPKPTKLVKELIADQTTHVTRGTTYDNKSNLAPGFYTKIIKKYEGTRLGRQELNAEILDDNPGALWNQRDIDDARVAKAPPLTRIVVAIDPSATSNENSDECGLIVVGMDGRDLQHGYVLEDATGIHSPDEWAKIAVILYHKWKADRIIGEANNGGDMIEAVIRHQDANVAYHKVTASRAKHVRAEPAAALYEQHRVHHVGQFGPLESELTQWNPKVDEESPNRLDAVVWGLTELFSGTDGWAQYVKNEAKSLAAEGVVPALPEARILVDGRNKDICECGCTFWVKIAGIEKCMKCALPRPL